MHGVATSLLMRFADTIVWENSNEALVAIPRLAVIVALSVEDRETSVTPGCTCGTPETMEKVATPLPKWRQMFRFDLTRANRRTKRLIQPARRGIYEFALSSLGRGPGWGASIFHLESHIFANRPCGP